MADEKNEELSKEELELLAGGAAPCPIKMRQPYTDGKNTPLPPPKTDRNPRFPT